MSIIGYVFRTYDVGRVPTTLGHIALIMLFIKSGILHQEFFPFYKKASCRSGKWLSQIMSVNLYLQFYFHGLWLFLIWDAATSSTVLHCIWYLDFSVDF